MDAPASGASSPGDARAFDDTVDGLRGELEGMRAALETSEARLERARAAAAQAGRLSKAYASVDEDVRRLTSALEARELSLIHI